MTGIYENSFEAKLVDKNDDSTFEIAEFDFDEISNGDLKLLKVGAIFYWSVGYASQNGQITKQSLLRFKHLPRYQIMSLTPFSIRLPK